MRAAPVCHMNCVMAMLAKSLLPCHEEEEEESA